MTANVGAAERTGVVTIRGNALTLVGAELKAGDEAPAFTAVANDMSTFTFKPKSGKVTIIAAVPSVDTPVCSTETKRFNEEASKLGDDVAILTISMDLPFAQKRWCAAEGVKNLQTISDYRDRAFGEAYGVKIKESGLLARSVFVVDKQGKVVYQQTVAELTREPDYEAALAAAKKAAGL
ncbi:MAG: thiol peroxidase [Tepidisphaerales bacterium]